MELIIKFILGVVSTIILSIVSNYIWDKIKNHSSTSTRKSGYEFEFKLIEFKFKKK